MPKFCSVISKAIGEDPIATAGNYDHWFIFELSPPWSEEFWQDEPLFQPMLKVIAKLVQQQGIKLRPLAIAPDREYSHRDLMRVFYYYRPQRLFARFTKQEYILPPEQVSPLIIALLTQPERLEEFAVYRQSTELIREILVCTHGNVDIACSRFGYPIYQQLRSEFVATSRGQLRVWQCSHFGGHRFAPTAIDLPEGRYWGHLEPKFLKQLIEQQGAISQLPKFYRGWAGLSRFEQIVEREIWQQEGWQWLDYYKAGRVLAIDETDKTWAEVRIDFASPDGKHCGYYLARVEIRERITTMGESDDETSFRELDQYVVKDFQKIKAA